MKIERPAGFTITDLGEDHPVERIIVEANGTTFIRLAHGPALPPFTQERIIALRDALTAAINGGEIEPVKPERLILIDRVGDSWYPLSNGLYTVDREDFEGNQRGDFKPRPNFGQTREWIEENWGPIKGEVSE